MEWRHKVIFQKSCYLHLNEIACRHFNLLLRVCLKQHLQQEKNFSLRNIVLVLAYLLVYGVKCLWNLQTFLEYYICLTVLFYISTLCLFLIQSYKQMNYFQILILFKVLDLHQILTKIVFSLRNLSQIISNLLA